MIQMAPPTPALARAQVILLNEEGAPAGSLTLEGGPHRLGRKHGPPFADDAFLDPNHVTVTATSAGLVIEDRGTVNGVFVRLEGRCELNDGDQFRAGQELLVFEKLAEPAQLGDAIEVLGSPNPGYWGRVGVLVAPRHLGRAMPIAGANFVIGRDAGDLLFPEDGYVSARHCQISNEGGRFYIEDLGSSNGTYLRARSHQTLPYGSYALIGQQLFRIEMG
jgi:pSer/pThr/pTyr-binding forkhead associated (FHA) protein